MMFPFSNEITLDSQRQVAVQVVRERIGSLLTPERRKKIDRVVSGRSFNVSLVLENIYDRGNASAAMRTAEALGFAGIEMIDPAKFKEANRVTQGADKWLEIRKWKTSLECINELKKEGKQVLATSLSERSIPIDEVDFSKPSAIILGNEKEGISPEAAEMSDHCVILPMVGFVQSYNISVAAALSLYHIFQERQRLLGASGDLSPQEQEILQAIYYMRTQGSSVEYLLELMNRGEIP